MTTKEEEILTMFKQRIDVAKPDEFDSCENWYIKIKLGTDKRLAAWCYTNSCEIEMNKQNVKISKELFIKIQDYFHSHLVKLNKTSSCNTGPISA